MSANEFSTPSMIPLTDNIRQLQNSSHKCKRGNLFIHDLNF